MIYAEKYTSKWSLSFESRAFAKKLRSHKPDVKNGWLVKSEMSPAIFAGIATVPLIFMKKLFCAAAFGYVDNWFSVAPPPFWRFIYKIRPPLPWIPWGPVPPVGPINPVYP